MVLFGPAFKSVTTISFFSTVAILDSAMVIDKLLEQLLPSFVVAVTIYSPPRPIKIVESTPGILPGKAVPFRVHV